MTRSTITRKGVRDIRTNADRSDQVNLSYKAFLRMGVMEMEKTRKLTELHNLERRVSILRDRIKFIEEEKSRLLALGQKSEMLSNDGPESESIASSQKEVEDSLDINEEISKKNETTNTIEKSNAQQDQPESEHQSRHVTSSRGLLFRY